MALSETGALFALGDIEPKLPQEGRYFIADNARVIGNVVVGEDVGIWFGSVLRGDNEVIHIGARSNVQEHCIFHTDPGFPLIIGENCTIGHRAMLHGCKVGENSLIGMGATVLNGAKIGKNCIIGAGALIAEGKEIPDDSLVVGMPGKVVRQLDVDAIEGLKKSADHYVKNFKRFLAEYRKV